MLLPRLLTATLLLTAVSAFAQQQTASASDSKATGDQQKSIGTMSGDVVNLFPGRVRSFRFEPRDPDELLTFDSVCYKMRSYVVTRDSKDSDSVHLTGYSTCQPASRYRLKRTQTPPVNHP